MPAVIINSSANKKNLNSQQNETLIHVDFAISSGFACLTSNTLIDNHYLVAGSICRLAGTSCYSRLLRSVTRWM